MPKVLVDRVEDLLEQSVEVRRVDEQGRRFVERLGLACGLAQPRLQASARDGGGCLVGEHFELLDVEQGRALSILGVIDDERAEPLIAGLDRYDERVRLVPFVLGPLADLEPEEIWALGEPSLDPMIEEKRAADPESLVAPIVATLDALRDLYYRRKLALGEPRGCHRAHALSAALVNQIKDHALPAEQVARDRADAVQDGLEIRFRPDLLGEPQQRDESVRKLATPVAHGRSIRRCGVGDRRRDGRVLSPLIVRSVSEIGHSLQDKYDGVLAGGPVHTTTRPGPISIGLKYPRVNEAKLPTYGDVGSSSS